MTAAAAAAGWLVLAWRLPHGPSTPRVTVWRSLRRMGAVSLTPGAAILPFDEDLQEQLDWLAQEVEALGGDAWVLPVMELSEAEEARVRAQGQAERQVEYEALRADAQSFRLRMELAGASGGYADRLRIEKELLALQRRFRKIRARDHFGGPGRRTAARAVDGCLAFRQGISAKLTQATDDAPVADAG
jgi:hypothetical protein